MLCPGKSCYIKGDTTVVHRVADLDERPESTVWPHLVPKLITRGKLISDESVVLHRVAGREYSCKFYTKRVSIYKTSGNEVYYTNSSILRIKMMLCSKLYSRSF